MRLRRSLSALVSIVAVHAWVGCGGGGGCVRGCERLHAMRAPEPVVRTPKVAGAAAPIGVNLAAIEDYSPSYPFTDVFKQSRAWISGSDSAFDDQRPLALDERGWVKALLPNQIARTLIFADVTPHYPKGKYTVLYEGKGAIDYRLTSLGPGGVTSSPGKDVIDVDSAGGHITINITATDAADPIRNIRMIAPAACAERPSITCDPASASAQPGCTCVDFASMSEPPRFHPAFIADHKAFGVVRFMDWLKTNNSAVTNDATRPKLSDARWSQNGAPYELAVQASEALGADPWINVPHGADDALVTAMATHLRDHVSKERRIYVELSNEAWNDIFVQSKWFADEARRRGVGGKDAYAARARAYSERVVEVMKLFEEVFGGTERIVRVMGAQAANPWLAEIELSHKGAYKNVDAVAIAPYLGGGYGTEQRAAATAAKSTQQLVDELRSKDIAEAAGFIAAHRKIADRYGVRLIAYEGGMHTVGVGAPVNDAQLNRLFDEVNRAPALSAVMTTYLQAWRDSGGEVFVYFNDTDRMTKWGRWGLREYAGQPRSEAPKLDGVLKFVETTPRWWP